MTDIKVGNLIAGFELDTDDFIDGIKGIELSLDGLKGAVSKVMASFTALMANPVALAAAGIAAVAALGKASYDAYMEMDEAYDKIAVGTGAVGDALDGLTESYDKFYRTATYVSEDAADTFANLNTYLGVTGDRLVSLAEQVSDLKGIGLEIDEQAYSQLMNRFSIAEEEMGLYLDYLLKVNQNTGASINSIMSAVQTSASSLDIFGYSLQESINLIGMMNKAGFETSSIPMALKQVTAAGITTREGFEDLITTIKNTTDTTKALEIAQEAFGTRVTNEMVAAIQAGAFAINGLSEDMEQYDGLVVQTAEDTADFPEKMDKIGRKMTETLAPAGAVLGDILVVVAEIAIAVLDHLTRMSEWIRTRVSRLIEPFVKLFTNLKEKFSKFWNDAELSFVEGAASLINPITLIVNNISNVFEVLIDTVNWFVETFEPIITAGMWLVVQVIDVVASAATGDFDSMFAALAKIAAAGMTLLYKIMETGWNAITGNLEGILQGIVNFIFRTINTAIDIVENSINGIISLINGLISGINSLNIFDRIPTIGYVSWHLNTPDIPEFSRFEDTALGKKMTDSIEDLLETSEKLSATTNHTIDTGIADVTNSLSNGFGGVTNNLNTGFTDVTTSLDKVISSSAENSRQEIAAINNLLTETKTLGQITEETAGLVGTVTDSYYDSSGNFVNRDDYYSGDYYFANATIEYLDDGRLVMTRENGDRLVMGEMKAGDREKYGIDSVFNVGGGVGGLMGNIAVDTRLKQEYEAYLAAKEAAEAAASKKQNSSSGGSSTSGSSSSKKPTISAIQQGTIVGTPTVTTPQKENKTYDSGGVTVNINGNVSNPSTVIGGIIKAGQDLISNLFNW